MYFIVQFSGFLFGFFVIFMFLIAPILFPIVFLIGDNGIIEAIKIILNKEKK